MKIKKIVKYSAEYIVLVIITYILRLLPLRFNLTLAQGLGLFLYRVNKKHRARAYDNLKQAFPEKTDEDIARILKEVYKNLCKYATHPNPERIKLVKAKNDIKMGPFFDIKKLRGTVEELVVYVTKFVELYIDHFLNLPDNLKNQIEKYKRKLISFRQEYPQIIL